MVCVGLSVWPKGKMPKCVLGNAAQGTNKSLFVTHNYTEYNQQLNLCSAFNPSNCTHLEQWAANAAAPRE